MKKAELERLWDNCDYEKLYNHYENRNCLLKMIDPFENFFRREALKREIKTEQGYYGLAKHHIKDGFKNMGICTAIALSAFLIAPPLTGMISNRTIDRNAGNFQHQIADYNERLEIFVQNIRELNLQDDFSIIMEVKRRLHEYGVGENGFMLSNNAMLDVRGHLGLDVVVGQGNCRHIAAFAQDALMELGIESDIVTTFMQSDAPSGAMFNNVERTFAPQTNSNENENFNPISPDSFIVRHLSGNHVINRINNLSVICNDTGELMSLNNVYIDMTNPQILMSIRGQNRLVSLNQTDENGEDWIQTRTHLMQPENTNMNSPFQIAVLHISDIVGGVSREQFNEIRNLLGINQQNEVLNNLRNNNELSQ